MLDISAKVAVDSIFIWNYKRPYFFQQTCIDGRILKKANLSMRQFLKAHHSEGFFTKKTKQCWAETCRSKAQRPSLIQIHSIARFSKYLLKTVLPYTCLCTHTMFGVNADTRDEDNQANVELYFRSLKHDEKMKDGRMKIGRYIREMQRIINGKHLNIHSQLKRSKYAKTGKVWNSWLPARGAKQSLIRSFISLFDYAFMVLISSTVEKILYCRGEVFTWCRTVNSL